MPLPRAVARFNHVVTNNTIGLLAPILPNFGVVTHVGRKSGRTFRTPVNVFKRGSEYIIALTYGAEADWVRNVLASGGCELKTMGRTVKLTNVRLFHDESHSMMPLPVRIMLGVIGANDFLRFDVAGSKN